MIDPLILRAFAYQDPPAPAAPAAQPAPSPLLTFVPFLLMIFLFYVLLIKPQRRQQKEREKMISALKKNDHVITSGGICGIVDRIKDNDVYLRVDEKSDLKLRVLRSAIAVVEKVSGADENPAEKK